MLNNAGVYEWTPARAAAAWNRAYRDWEDALGKLHGGMLLVGLPGSGKSTWIAEKQAPGLARMGLPPEIAVFDATNTSRIGRRPLIEIAQSLDKQVEALLFQVPLITALRRNAERPPERRVPFDTMARMARQLDEDMPCLSEGFWRITRASW
jgi:predicted kinase